MKSLFYIMFLAPTFGSVRTDPVHYLYIHIHFAQAAGGWSTVNIDRYPANTAYACSYVRIDVQYPFQHCITALLKQQAASDHTQGITHEYY